MKCSKGYAGGDVQPEFIWIYHLRAALAPGSSRREAQQLQVIHRTHRGGPLLIIGGWIVQKRSCGSESGAGLPRSLVAGRRRRGLTEPLGRGGASVSKIAQSLISAPQPVRHRPQVARLREFSLPMPAATHDQRIGRSPRFGRIGPAAQLSCALLSAVFLCVVGVLCFAGVSLAFRYAAPHLTLHNFSQCLGGRAAACGMAGARSHLAGDAHFRRRLCARHCIARHCDALRCMHRR